jgi:hypothetical protein
MIRSTRKFLAASLIAIALTVAAPRALAAQSQQDREIVDARLEGYKDGANMTLEGGGTGLTWFLLIILGIVGSIGLFKDAKRSHLD